MEVILIFALGFVCATGLWFLTVYNNKKPPATLTPPRFNKIYPRTTVSNGPNKPQAPKSVIILDDAHDKKMMEENE